MSLTTTNESNSAKPVGWPSALLSILIAGICYWIAFATRQGAIAVFGGLPSLFLISRLKTPRRAFYGGLLACSAIYAPQLWFFYSIFHVVVIALWTIAALPIAIFCLLLHQSRSRFGPTSAMLLTPILWTGIEFFRSELYYFKFAWILPGQAIAFLPGVRLMRIGVYGLGFLIALAAALRVGPRPLYRICGLVMMIVLAILMYWPESTQKDLTAGSLHVAGIQLEHPSEHMVVKALEQLATVHPEAQLLVLSEYTFDGPVPESVREIVRRHSVYLIAGGVVELKGDNFRDVVFVIGPDGTDLFQQCKSVPVQLMQDGLPATERKVWDSPWGKIGIAICYDISYARVMDDFVRAGAKALIIPTMDLQSWGRYEREMLHGRLAPIRAAEYGIPVFGVWSSGESQLTDKQGHVIATAGYPGQGEMISGTLDMSDAGRVPIDRYPALATSLLTLCVFLYFAGLEPIRRRRTRTSVNR